MSSDEEWNPEAEDLRDADDSEGDLDALEEDDEDEAGDLRDDLEEAFLDPFSLLERMGDQQADNNVATAKQPFEILAENALKARAQHAGPSRAVEGASGGEEEGKPQKTAKKKGKGAGFGASVEDIWDEDVAADLGLGIGLSTKVRRRQKARLKRRRKALAEGKRMNKIPEEVTRKIGEANLLYVTARYEEAIKLLLEVVKLAPNLADPYQTLGQLHEVAGDKRKALNFYMFAAHLKPKDIDLWRRLATLSAELGFQKQAVYCLNKVLVRDRSDLDARWDRAMLFLELGELKKAVAEFEAILTSKPGDSEAPKMLAHLFHQLGQPEKAIEALEKHLKEHQLAADFTHGNMLAELYMEGCLWQKAFDLIRQMLDMHCRGNTAIPLDFQVKASICLLHLGNMEAAKPGLQALLQANVDNTEDLYQEAANALLETGFPETALKLYKELQNAQKGGHELLTKLAAGYKGMHDLTGAVEVYTIILRDEAIAMEKRRAAALDLAELYESFGDKSKAHEALHVLEGLGQPDIELLSRMTQLLLKMGDQEGYLEVMMPLMDATLRNSIKKTDRPGLTRQAQRRKNAIARPKNIEEQDAVFKGYVIRDRRKHPPVEAAEQPDAPDNAEEAASEPDEDGGVLFRDIARDKDHFEALTKTATVLIESGKPLQASELVAECLSRLTSKRSANKMKKESLRVLAAEAALVAGEPALSLFHLRYAAENCPYSIPIWNMFCEAAGDVGSLKQAQRAASILKQTISDCLPLKLVHGHCLALNNAHGRALAEYMSAYNSEPDNPLVLLCIGVAHLNQAVSRKVPDRDEAILAAFSFIKGYSRKRNNQQESLYNLGRAAHQVGLLYLAVQLYQRALSAPVPLPLKFRNRVCPRTPKVDLSREIAHNLVLIYRSTGATTLARQVMRRHLVF